MHYLGLKSFELCVPSSLVLDEQISRFDWLITTTVCERGRTLSVGLFWYGKSESKYQFAGLEWMRAQGEAWAKRNKWAQRQSTGCAVEEGNAMEAKVLDFHSSTRGSQLTVLLHSIIRNLRRNSCILDVAKIECSFLRDNFEFVYFY